MDCGDATGKVWAASIFGPKHAWRPRWRLRFCLLNVLPLGFPHPSLAAFRGDA